MKKCIVCPKCNNKTLCILDSPRCGLECFCDFCSLYFGWAELKEHWNIDIGDFYDIVPCQHNYIKTFPPFVPDIFVQYTFCVDCGKRWNRNIDMVSEPEFENFDEFLKNQFGIDYTWDFNPFPEGTTNQGIDIGIDGYPI